MRNKNAIQWVLSITIGCTLFAWRCHKTRIGRNHSKEGDKRQTKLDDFSLKKLPQKNIFATLDLSSLYQYLFEDKVLKMYQTILQTSQNISHRSLENFSQSNYDDPFHIDQLFGPMSDSILQNLNPKHPLKLIYATLEDQPFDTQNFSFQLAQKILTQLPKDSTYDPISQSLPKMGETRDSLHFDSLPLAKQQPKNKIIYAQMLYHNQGLYKEAIQDLTDQTIHQGKVFTCFPSDEEIKEKFNALEGRYRYYMHQGQVQNEAQMAFTKGFKIAKVVIDHLQRGNYMAHDPLTEDYAYKMVLFFGPNGSRKSGQQTEMLSQCNQYLHQYHRSSNHPIQEAFDQVKLAPCTRKINLAAWQKVIKNHGPKAMQFFGQASRIEEEQSLTLNKNQDFDFQQIQNIAALLKFPHAKQNEELARIAIHYPAFTATDFSSSLEALKKTKQTDDMPNIMVNGGDTGHPAFYLVKLPISDPRGCLLGHITNCCQSINREMHQCVIDGIQRPKSGFYVLLKGKNKDKDIEPIKNLKIDYTKYHIIGQGYAWMSQDQNFTFDSWENLRNESDGYRKDDGVIFDMLQSFGRIAMQKHNIKRVTIGLGGKTPKPYYWSSRKKVIPEQISIGFASPDATYQGRVYDQDIKDLHDKLCRVWNISIEKLSSIRSRQPTMHQPNAHIDFINNPETLANYPIGADKNLLSAVLHLLEAKVMDVDELHKLEKLRTLSIGQCQLLFSDLIMNYIINHGFSLEGFQRLDMEKLKTIHTANIPLEADDRGTCGPQTEPSAETLFLFAKIATQHAIRGDNFFLTCSKFIHNEPKV